MEITTTKLSLTLFSFVLILLLLMILRHDDSLVLYDSRTFENKTGEPALPRRNPEIYRYFQNRSERTWNLCKSENMKTSKNVPWHIQYIFNQKVSKYLVVFITLCKISILGCILCCAQVWLDNSQQIPISKSDFSK